MAANTANNANKVSVFSCFAAFSPYSVVGVVRAVRGYRLFQQPSHHIFIHAEIPELLNMQNVGGQAKPYQIRQFLRLLERYNMILENDR